MGFHATRGNATTAPVYHFNHCGCPTWCGRAISSMTSSEVLAMVGFCTEEGWRQGHNDRHYDRVDEAGSNLFDPSFADGVPHRIWQEAYTRGAESTTCRPAPAGGD